MIQREVQDRLAEAILAGEVHDGQSVTIDAGDGGLLLLPESAAAPAASAAA